MRLRIIARVDGGDTRHAGETAEGHVEVFERHRPHLFNLGYRMLGSAAEAEDVVQDAYLRWHQADAEAIETPVAWLTTVVTRLCLTRLTAARARRETYVGPWLPEPVVTENGVLGPLETVEQREMVSFGFMVLLERLTPPERAVFVLREAFGHSHRDIARILDIEEAHSRQLHARARQHVESQRRKFEADEGKQRRIVEGFIHAVGTGDVARLERLLAEDVEAWSDGGGKVPAARKPTIGRDRVLDFLRSLGARPEAAYVEGTVAEVNGCLAAVMWLNGRVTAVVVPELRDGLAVAFRTVVNPDKLATIEAQLA